MLHVDLLAPILALLVPTLLVLAAFVPQGRVRSGLLLAEGAVFVGLVGVFLQGGGGVLRWSPSPWTELTALRADAVTMVVLGLVGLVGAVLWRFSGTYLAGDPGLPRYRRAMLLTLAGVSGLVLANHLFVLAACWTGISVALHQLLTHFSERREAQLAAHKKFLASRLADLCLLCVGMVLWEALGTLSLDRVGEAVRAGGVSPVLQLAGVLLVVCVSLRSAQLPFHGWLTQVMEAPTPVSALLHAGVVNMGGVVLLRLSDLLVQLPVAQTLMVLVGTTTAVLASLVGATRVSVKVSLAWSTMAQMGFMLLQCGLGAWPVALLHLVAHSLYKAHAFLSSGSAVERTLSGRLADKPEPASVARWLGAGAAGIGVVAATGLALGVDPTHEPSLWALAGIVGLALAPLLAEGSLWTGLVAGAAVSALYFGWHRLFLELVPPAPGPWLGLQLALVTAGFGAGFVAQALLRGQPGGAFSRAVQPALFAGLYLDAWFTRLTFWVWPPRLTPTPPRALHLVRTRELR